MWFFNRSIASSRRHRLTIGALEKPIARLPVPGKGVAPDLDVVVLAPLDHRVGGAKLYVFSEGWVGWGFMQFSGVMML